MGSGSRAQEIRLVVLETNEAAEKFWRSLGYRELRRVGPDTFKSLSHHRVELSRPLAGNLAASPA
jgi:ribosomal protein S18 acetylase RimI-like enzyme